MVLFLFPTIIANSVKAEDAKPTGLKQETVMTAGFPKRGITDEKVDKTNHNDTYNN
jgi:hypothetical protein